jgi:hypothetical protein
MRYAQSHHPAEITNSGSSRPSANSPSGRATLRDANPSRSLAGPALLRGWLQIGAGLPWPGQAERLVLEVGPLNRCHPCLALQ